MTRAPTSNKATTTMTTDLIRRAAAQRPLTDRTLIRIGAAFALAAGTLRLPASFIDPDSDGAAIDALYYAIDISLLFAVITAYVAIASSRTRLGSLGFAIAAAGAGLLIGPEPTDASVDYYAIGASAVTIGFATLAIAWKHTPLVSPPTRTAFLATPAIGIVAGLHDAAFVAAGVVFSFALFALARDLRRRSVLAEGEER
jgi:hypothetical protein